MTFNALNRKVHYWASIIVAVPFLVVIATGLMLQLKKQITWIQPAEQRGAGTEPALSLPAVLAIAKAVGEAEVASWIDVKRIDVRPEKGLVKLTSVSDWEIQIDASTGAVLHSAPRRSDLIESLHDGSFFGSVVKLGVFLPVAAVMFGMWLTGIYLFLLPFLVKRRRAAKLIR
ncbi:MAG: PepSY domain-containing protein [Rhodanobacter sp.]